MQNKVRVKYQKLGRGQYISHLDLLRTFNRALRRAEIPVAYSQGFNPHMQVSHAFPLPMYTTSECEYIDIVLEAELDPQELLHKLNQNLPTDIAATKVYSPLASFNDIGFADYALTFSFSDGSDPHNQVVSFFESAEIIVAKKGKAGIKNIDIRPMILSHSVVDGGSVTNGGGAADGRSVTNGGSASDSGSVVHLTVVAGGDGNLSPQLVINALSSYLKDSKIEDFSIHRMQIYDKNKNIFE